MFSMLQPQELRRQTRCTASDALESCAMNRNFPQLLYSGEAEETPSIKAQASNLSEAPDHTGPQLKNTQS